MDIDELKMRVSKEIADIMLEISRLYNSQGKIELATLAQRFAAQHLQRYAAYTKRMRARAVG
ncbi:MAG: hypothetical protein DKT66_05880 [Candidatus Melainabacteria bacterium]|nr:MAG: hypothetical protein DKT66_05880 [Candidatus Melainabacteria bacterium]